MKKIITSIFMLFLLIFVAAGDVVHANDALDYTNGWFDKNPGKFTISDSKAVDNDLSTSASVSSNKKLTITFNEGISLSLLSFYTVYANYPHSYEFYNESNELLKTVDISASSNESGTKYILLNLDDVKKIVVTRVSSNVTYIREIEIFERQPRAMIKNIKSETTHSSATLHWDAPTEDDYNGAIIKYDDEIIYKASAEEFTHTIKNLKINASHTFSIAAVYDDGTTSAYQDVTVKTKEAPTVKDLSIKNIKDTSAAVSWTNPIAEDIDGINIYRDDKLIEKLPRGATSYLLKSLAPETEYKIEVSLLFGEVESAKQNILFKTKDIIDSVPPSDVTELQAKQENKNVKLTYKFPVDPDFSHVQIYRNSIKIEESVIEESYVDKKVNENITYTYKVIAYDTSGNASQGITVQITTVGVEIFDLKAKAKSFEEVNLFWENPKREDLEHIAIYRKEKNKSTSFFRSLFSGDGYTKLFETNGTEFKDFTVSADTEYSYKLTTSINGVESDGQTVNVKTPKTKVNGGGTEVDENGDYLITWDSPATGKIKVLIAGKEHAIVPAADKQIIIPKDKMKFDLLGMPDVQLIPIDDNGNEGIPSKPGGGGSNGGGIGDIVGGGTDAAEITPENTLDMAVGLFLLVGGFLLLGMSFWLVPKLIRVIRQALGNKNGQTEIGRRTS